MKTSLPPWATNHILRGSLAIIFGYLGAFFFILITRNIVTNNTTLEVAGQVTTLGAIVSISVILSIQGMHPAVPLAIKKHDDIQSLTRGYLVIGSISTLTVTSILIFILPVISDQFQFIWTAPIILFTLIAALFTTLGQITEMAALPIGKPWIATYRRTLSQAFILIAVATLILTPTFDSVYPPLAWVIALTIGLGLSAIIPLHKTAGKQFPSRQEVAAAWHSIKADIAHHHASKLGTMLPTFIMPLLVAALLGTAQAAPFAIVWSITTLLFLIPSAAGQAALTQTGKEETSHPVRTALIISTVLVSIPLTVIAFFSEQILTLFGREYADAATFLEMLALTVIPLIVIETYITYLRLQNHLRTVTTLTILLGGALIIFTILIVPGSPTLETLGNIYLISYIAIALLFTIATPILVKSKRYPSPITN